MYETLLSDAYSEDIDVIDRPFRGRIKGLYFNRVIALNTNIDTTVEKTCILAEELGHYYTSAGDILDQSCLNNWKQEQRARRWGYEKLVPLDKLISVCDLGIQSPSELAESLDVTEEFLVAALLHYVQKYGICHRIGDCWIRFEPLRIYRRIKKQSK